LPRRRNRRRKRCLGAIARLFTLRGRTFLFFASDSLGCLFRLGEASLTEALGGISLPISGSFMHATSYGIRLSHNRTLPLSAVSP
jgi:hypothetical protein